MVRPSIVALLIVACGGCAPAVKTYLGPDRRGNEIAILRADGHHYVKIDADGRIQSVAAIGSTPGGVFWALRLGLAEREYSELPVLRGLVIDVLDSDT